VVRLLAELELVLDLLIELLDMQARQPGDPLLEELLGVERAASLLVEVQLLDVVGFFLEDLLLVEILQLRDLALGTAELLLVVAHELRLLVYRRGLREPEAAGRANRAMLLEILLLVGEL